MSFQRPLISLSGIREKLESILPQVASGAAERERERVLPVAQVAAVADTGVLSVRIPRQFGGPGATVAEAATLLIAISAADTNVAQAIRTHFTFVEALMMSGNEAEEARWFSRSLDGQILSATGAEIGGRHGEIKTRVEKRGEILIANGRKFYSTGCLFADWIASVALNEDDQTVVFIIPRDRRGMTMLDDFDAIGQRLTASGTTILEDVEVNADEILMVQMEGIGRTLSTTFAQLYLACLHAGIAQKALQEAIKFAQEKARPINYSGVARSVDDPYVREAVGTMSAAVFGTEAVVLRAAEAVDRAWQCSNDRELGNQASIAVAKAQLLAARAAMDVAQTAFDVGGGLCRCALAWSRPPLAKRPYRGKPQPAALEGGGDWQL